MEYLIGALIVAVLWLMYDKYRPKTKAKETKEEREEREKLEKHYSSMMNYDVDKAYGGKSK